MSERTCLSLRRGPFTLLVEITGWTQDQWDAIGALITQMEIAEKRLGAHRTNQDPANT